MRTLLTLVVLLSAGAAPAQYAPALVCFERADQETTLSNDDAYLLCQGAGSAAPVDCFLRAKNELVLGDAQRIALCRCATTTEPVECASQAKRRTTLSDDRILGTCAARSAARLADDCSPRQYQGPQLYRLPGPYDLPPHAPVP